MLERVVARYSTEFGEGALEITELGVCKVWLPGDDLPEKSENDHSYLDSQAINGAKQLEQYFNGELKQFDIAVDISGLTLFRQKVLAAAMQITFGTVTSYKELAELVGVPKGARAVGGSLAANPVPIFIPCHRIVASNGALTGFSAAGGILMKQKLLQLEGADLSRFTRQSAH